MWVCSYKQGRKRPGIRSKRGKKTEKIIFFENYSILLDILIVEFC